MEVIKTIIVTKDDILNHFISIAEDCSTVEAKKVANVASIDCELAEEDNNLIKVIITYNEATLNI